MSCYIEKSILTNEQKKEIIKLLTFIPVKDVYSKFDTPADPIYFYQTTSTHINIPYMTASTVLQMIPNEDKVFKSVNMDFTGTLRDYQISIHQEMKEQLDNYGTTLAGLNPGAGKTILAARCCSDYKLLTAVLVTQTILVDQWKKTFENHTTSKVWIVGEKEPPVYDVIICMDQRWQKIPDDIRRLVGTLVIDEAHLFCTPSRIGCLLAFQPYYIILETATLERDDELHQMMYAIAGTHGVFRESTKPFYVHKILTNVKVERKLNRQRKTDFGKLQKETLLDTRRLDIIYNFVKHHKEASILILTKSKEHVRLLQDEISTFDSCDSFYGNKKSYNDCRILIGTDKKIGTGFDQETFCKSLNYKRFDLLILAFSIKKYQVLIQTVGRIMRSEIPYVFHLVDDDPIFHNHWQKCQKWYKARNATMTIFNIDDKIIDMNEDLLE